MKTVNSHFIQVLKFILGIIHIYMTQCQNQQFDHKNLNELQYVLKFNSHLTLVCQDWNPLVIHM